MAAYDPDPNWARWIFTSVCKHFDDRKGSYTLYIEGQHRNAERPKDFLELRIDGPWIIKLDSSSYDLLSRVDVLIQSNMDDSSWHRIHTDVGYVSSLFTTIELYKYGNGPDDDQSQWGCLRLQTSNKERKRLKISHFGQIRPSMNLMQASVEGEYKVTVER